MGCCVSAPAAPQALARPTDAEPQLATFDAADLRPVVPAPRSALRGARAGGHSQTGTSQSLSQMHSARTQPAALRQGSMPSLGPSMAATEALFMARTGRLLSLSEEELRRRRSTQGFSTNTMSMYPTSVAAAAAAKAAAAAESGESSDDADPNYGRRVAASDHSSRGDRSPQPAPRGSLSCSARNVSFKEDPAPRALRSSVRRSPAPATARAVDSPRHDFLLWQDVAKPVSKPTTPRDSDSVPSSAAAAAALAAGALSLSGSCNGSADDNSLTGVARVAARPLPTELVLAAPARAPDDLTPWTPTLGPDLRRTPSQASEGDFAAFVPTPLLQSPDSRRTSTSSRPVVEFGTLPVPGRLASTSIDSPGVSGNPLLPPPAVVPAGGAAPHSRDLCSSDSDTEPAEPVPAVPLSPPGPSPPSPATATPVASKVPARLQGNLLPLDFVVPRRALPPERPPPERPLYDSARYDSGRPTPRSPLRSPPRSPLRSPLRSPKASAARRSRSVSFRAQLVDAISFADSFQP